MSIVANCEITIARTHVFPSLKSQRASLVSSPNSITLVQKREGTTAVKTDEFSENFPQVVDQLKRLDDLHFHLNLENGRGRLRTRPQSEVR